MILKVLINVLLFRNVFVKQVRQGCICTSIPKVPQITRKDCDGRDVFFTEQLYLQQFDTFYNLYKKSYYSSNSFNFLLTGNKQKQKFLHPTFNLIILQSIHTFILECTSPIDPFTLYTTEVTLFYYVGGKKLHSCYQFKVKQISIAYAHHSTQTQVIKI